MRIFLIALFMGTIFSSPAFATTPCPGFEASMGEIEYLLASQSTDQRLDAPYMQVRNSPQTRNMQPRRAVRYSSPYGARSGRVMAQRSGYSRAGTPMRIRLARPYTTVMGQSMASMPSPVSVPVE